MGSWDKGDMRRVSLEGDLSSVVSALCAGLKTFLSSQPDPQDKEPNRRRKEHRGGSPGNPQLFHPFNFLKFS